MLHLVGCTYKNKRITMPPYHMRKLTDTVSEMVC